MGNLKRYGGSLTPSWHNDQLNIQIQTLARYEELGIMYALPAFAGFVPDQIAHLYPDHNFTMASSWVGFDCKYSWYGT
jgi:hypothetical protein